MGKDVMCELMQEAVGATTEIQEGIFVEMGVGKSVLFCLIVVFGIGNAWVHVA